MMLMLMPYLVASILKSHSDPATPPYLTSFPITIVMKWQDLVSETPIRRHNSRMSCIQKWIVQVQVFGAKTKVQLG